MSITLTVARGCNLCTFIILLLVNQPVHKPLYSYTSECLQVHEEDAVQSANCTDHVRSTDEVDPDQEGSTCTPTCAVAVQQSRPSLPKRSMLEKALPRPFIVPTNFSPMVARSLNGKAAVKYVMEIAQALLHFKSYPTREEKEHVARQCVKAYSFLEASSGTGHVSTYDTIMSCIA